MKKFLIIACVAMALSGCMKEEDQQRVAAEALWDAGYSKVVLGKSSSYRCGEDDTYGREFVATGPAGRPNVTGVVCFDSYKATTIRLYRR